MFGSRRQPGHCFYKLKKKNSINKIRQDWFIQTWFDKNMATLFDNITQTDFF